MAYIHGYVMGSGLHWRVLIRSEYRSAKTSWDYPAGANSCITNLGWLKAKQNHGMLTPPFSTGAGFPIHSMSPQKIGWFHTWWFIPVGKWAVTLVISMG